MNVGAERAGEEWIDLTGTRQEKITIGEDGSATFLVNGGSVSVWASPDEDRTQDCAAEAQDKVEPVQAGEDKSK